MSKVKVVFAGAWHINADALAFGNKGGLPWGHLKEDLQSFKRNTNNSVLIMGANTFKSLPGKLSGRLHCVMSSSSQNLKTQRGDTADTVIHGGSLSDAIDFVRGLYPERDICVIGGKSLILEAIKMRLADEIHCNIIYPRQQLEYDVSIDKVDFCFERYGYDKVSEENENLDHDICKMLSIEIWEKEV